MENENVLVVSKNIGKWLSKSSKYGFTEVFFIKTKKDLSRNTFYIVKTYQVLKALVLEQL